MAHRDDMASPASLPGRGPLRAFYDGRSLGRVQSVADLRARAHKLLPRFVLEYLEGGAGDEASLAREREAFADWRFLPRMLQDASERRVRATLLTRQSRLPLAIAPTGLNGLFAYEADLMLARAAARFGVPFTQGTMSNERLEEVAAVPGLRHWWQLYVFGDDHIWQSLVDRADKAGCEALVLTVNAQTYGMREWDSRQRMNRTMPTPGTVFDAARHPRWAVGTLRQGMPEFVNVREFIPEDRQGFFQSAFWIRDQMPKDLSWRDVSRIRERWPRALLIKGLLHPDDVRAAIDHGADGVVLGTHGGRQADWSLCALDVLQEARTVVPEDKLLMMSGGIRRGADILKAVALGADAVMIGRATLYGLAAHGEAGVKKVLELLEHEMLNDLAQIGVGDVCRLSSSNVRRAPDPVPGYAAKW